MALVRPARKRRPSFRRGRGDSEAVRRTTIGFAAVSSLVARRVDAVVTFWNAEGAALRERGVRTREFRVDDFGAPRYPELVLATTSKTLKDEPGIVRDTVAALKEGTREALADLPATAKRVARASDGEAGLVRAQLDAVAPALQPALELDRGALERWARFDKRFGILQSPPEVEEAFALELR